MSGIVWKTGNFQPKTCMMFFLRNTKKKKKNLRSTLVKDSLLSLNQQFTHMINMSLATKSIPNACKENLCKCHILHKLLFGDLDYGVIPIPKQGDLSDVTNYRPISLLPLPGKVLEKLVHTQMNDFLEEESLLTEHSFRKNKSTLHAVTQLLNSINYNLNKRTPTVALFIDFRKAFDCLQYPLLLEKLKRLNFSDDTVEWVQNNLSNRCQSTYANEHTSALKDIKQGVTQGSILGLLLYIIYANDIATTIRKSKVAFYADDTVLYVANKDINKAVTTIQKDLTRLSKWCEMNSIRINPTKTKYIVFSNKKLDVQHKVLEVDGKQIEKVATFNYLGIVLDQYLTFNNHSQRIISRV